LLYHAADRTRSSSFEEFVSGALRIFIKKENRNVPAARFDWDTQSITQHTDNALRESARASVDGSRSSNRMRRLLKRHFGEWICPDVLIERMMEYM
jgi:hypothetical protein